MLFRGVDIHDWHRGEMSSRRLLVLIEHLPEDSAFKTAARDGMWSLQQQLTTGAWNEIKAMRGDLWAYLGNEILPFRPVLSPADKRDHADRRSQLRAGHDDLMAQLGKS